MTNEDYIRNTRRLKEIEQQVKDPEFSLDKMDSIIEETTRLAAECRAYTRTLTDKVEALDFSA